MGGQYIKVLKQKSVCFNGTFFWIQKYYDAITSVQNLIQFSAHINSPRLFELFYEAKGLLQADRLENSVQPTLPDLWKN